MNVGYQIRTHFPRRDRGILEQFADIPIPNIGDCMSRTAAISARIRPYNTARLMGTAYTVRVPAGDNLLFYYAIDNAKPGDVIVVDGGGFIERALCGEIMATFAQKKGLAGFVIHGAIRDGVEIGQMDFPVFAMASCPNGPYKNGPGEVNVPVNVGGRIICPGDFLIGDGDGLVAFHPEDAEDLLEKAHAVMQKEAHMMNMIESEGRMDLQWMYDKLTRDRVEIN